MVPIHSIFESNKKIQEFRENNVKNIQFPKIIYIFRNACDHFEEILISK